jgi:hypothetical protein
LTNDYTGGGNACALASSGIDRVLVMDLPTGLRATVTVMPSPGLDISLSGATSPENCSARRCTSTVDVAAAGGTETISYVNGSGATQQYFVIIDSSAADAGFLGAYVSVVTPPQGDTCFDPIPLGGSVSIASQSVSAFVADGLVGADFSCGFARGADLVYSVSAPAGQALTATLTPDYWSQMTVVLKPRAGSVCGQATPCLARTDTSGVFGAGTLSWTNQGAGATDVLIFVTDDPAGTSTATYSLIVDIH